MVSIGTVSDKTFNNRFCMFPSVNAEFYSSASTIFLECNSLTGDTGTYTYIWFSLIWMLVCLKILVFHSAWLLRLKRISADWALTLKLQRLLSDKHDSPPALSKKPLKNIGVFFFRCHNPQMTDPSLSEYFSLLHAIFRCIAKTAYDAAEWDFLHKHEHNVLFVMFLQFWFHSSNM